MSEALPSFISDQVLDASYFFLNLEPVKKEELRVVCGGLEKCSPDYRLEREEFDYLGVEYVVSGQAKAIIGERSENLRPGCVFGYMPHTYLRIESEGMYPLKKYFVDLSGARAEQMFEESPLRGGGILEMAGSRWVEEIFRQLVKFGSPGGPRANRSCEMLAEVLLMQIGENEIDSEEAESPAYRSYRRCKERIQGDYLRISSVAELASFVRLDQAYIARLFKKYDDESPYRNLVRLKLGHAARLLLRERCSVKFAASEAGFGDAAHFSRVFKKAYGVSPARFPESVKRG
ncbi:MAG: AraC family transcriptional regulator [Verrucomicrobiota bacterium]